MDANRLKAALIDHLLACDDAIVLGAEVPFSDGRRKADLIATGNNVAAYEIKSDRDSLDTLERQLDDYTKCFEQVYVVGGPSQIRQLKARIPKSVGLIRVDEHVQPLRPAHIRSNLVKAELAKLFSRNELDRLLSERGKRPRYAKALTASELRTIVLRTFRRSDLVEFARTALASRLENRFEHFIRHRGQITHTEDLYYLTSTTESLADY